MSDKKEVSLIQEEAALRSRGSHPYDHGVHDVLSEMNRLLRPLERTLSKTPKEGRFPFIFIHGLPRSGTTFITQLIFNHLQVSCINNLQARFWDAPVLGAVLSEMIVGDGKSDTYDSQYARTSHITAPHEFGYFWRKQFMLEDPSTSYPEELEGKVDWNYIRDTLVQISEVKSNPLVIKTLEISGYYAERFDELFPNAVYVYIKRNPLQVARSIAKARISHYGNVQTWWSSYPREYPLLKSAPYEEQIAGQIAYLAKMFDGCKERIDPKKIIEIDYESLCNAPSDFANLLQERLRELYNYDLEQVHAFPEFTPADGAVVDQDIEAKLIQGLTKYGLYPG